MGRLPACFPQQVISALVRVAAARLTDIYLVGGVVRDWLLGRSPGDLDLTVPADAAGFCRDLVRELGGGALVDLGGPQEDAARIVWRGQEIDVTAFRGGGGRLLDDLALRDFTVNSMAVSLLSLVSPQEKIRLIDPLGGFDDLASRVLRACPRAFRDDPLRLLRAFRFMATLELEPEPETLQAIEKHAAKIERVAAERIRYELDLIIESPRGCAALRASHQAGLLRQVLPELYAGDGVEQPEFHHLDVFKHNLQTLAELEWLMESPQRAYPDGGEQMCEYLARPHVGRCLKWAALLHDIGKPAAMQKPLTPLSRVTFYGHDESGRELFEMIARRLRWSNDDRRRTGTLIAMHMHPFHLCTVRQSRQLTRRAALKLCRKAGDHLPGLFLLAMADSLASRGALKPEDMEKQLVRLYREVLAIYEANIRPALSGKRLLTGGDLIETFRLTPGPIFAEILEELEAAQVEGEVANREQALAWVAAYLQKIQKKTKGAAGGAC